MFGKIISQYSSLGRHTISNCLSLGDESRTVGGTQCFDTFLTSGYNVDIPILLFHLH